MKDGFRQSMAWLHTWTGLLVGWILFLVFCTGTAAYYRDEITFWMKPELHAASLALPRQPEAAERALETLQKRAPGSPRWSITLPSERHPAAIITWTPAPVRESAQDSASAGNGQRRVGRLESVALDTETGEPLATPRQTRGGDFFYRLHFDLHYMPQIWGRWIVGFCAMFMLVAIISGVITHRRIFADFFTFRPKKSQRSWLDAHNAAAVFALPFHLMITYSGLVTLMFILMPWGQQAIYKGTIDAFYAEVFTDIRTRVSKPSGQETALAPLGPMIKQASARWGGAAVNQIVITHPNDAKATISMQRREGHDMASTQPVALFDGVTGKLLSTRGEIVGAAGETRSVVYGLHIGRFANPLLRALFFLSGLAGCVMVATGLVMWAVKERQKYAKVLACGGHISIGLRLVEGLNVGAIGGVPIAIASYFWANRLLPAIMPTRAEAEITWFFIALGVAMVVGMVWPKRLMWKIQFIVGGVLFAGIPVLNAFTTYSHLGVSLPAGMWRLAGIDLTCMALGITLLVTAWWLDKKKNKLVKAHKGAVSQTVHEARQPGAA